MLNCLLKGISLMLLLTCISLKTFSQITDLQGVVFEKQSGARVANAVIQDLKNKNTAASNELGIFSVKASIGDTLKISKTNYNDYFYTVVDQKTIIAQISPLIQLNEVKIFGKSKTQELNDALGQYKSQGSFYNGKPPVLSFLSSPITGFYELFGKTPGQARRFQAFTKTETQQLTIDRRFTKGLVKQVTDLKDDQVQPFMDAYRPSFEQMNAWTDYDLINYIKKSAQGFKDGKGLPPLKKLY